MNDLFITEQKEVEISRPTPVRCQHCPVPAANTVLLLAHPVPVQEVGLQLVRLPAQSHPALNRQQGAQWDQLSFSAKYNRKDFFFR